MPRWAVSIASATRKPSDQRWWRKARVASQSIAVSRVGLMSARGSATTWAAAKATRVEGSPWTGGEFRGGPGMKVRARRRGAAGCSGRGWRWSSGNLLLRCRDHTGGTGLQCDRRERANCRPREGRGPATLRHLKRRDATCASSSVRKGILHEVRGVSADVPVSGHRMPGTRAGCGISPDTRKNWGSIRSGSPTTSSPRPLLRRELARFADDAVARRGDHGAGAPRHLDAHPAGAAAGGAGQGDRDPPAPLRRPLHLRHRHRLVRAGVRSVRRPQAGAWRAHRRGAGGHHAAADAAGCDFDGRTTTWRT